VSALAAVFLAYLLGSIPTGVLLGRIAGVDVRSVGSGNIGATNVARTAGRALGILTLVGDLLKGLVPVVIVRSLGEPDEVVSATGVAALAGHLFSIFLRMRGGKGVATGAGVLIGLAPTLATIPLALFVGTFAVSRIVSLASIVAAVSAPIALFLGGRSLPATLAALVISMLIVWRHQENMSRLLAGTEPRFTSRK
jgi:acyl phosphate:glycerol-3-phosphate acyltransferase